MRRLWSLLIIGLTLTTVSQAEDVPTDAFIVRPGVRGASGRTIGYIDQMMPLHSDEKNLTFLNLKTTVGDKDDNEINLGVGYRTLTIEDKAIVGINAFFDTRRSPNANRFKQLGFGAELLTGSLDVRSNAYLPLDEKAFLSDSRAYAFGNTNIVLNNTALYEEPMSGFDYEMGVPLPFLKEVVDNRVFAGGYHYNSEIGEDINGFRGRMEIQPNAFVTFQLEMTDDSARGRDHFLGGYFTIPFGGIQSSSRGLLSFAKNLFRLDKPRSLKERMNIPVIRDIDITSRSSPVTTVESVAVDHLIHVDNTASSGGNGSVNAPYNTLAAAISASTSGDWIYVHQGDGTATGLTGDFTLVDNTTLWGDGYEAFSGLGGNGYPVISSGGTGTAITVGTNNTIQGLHIKETNYGILLPDEAPGTLVIRNNIISDLNTDTSNSGIRLITDDSGTITIQNNTISHLIPTDPSYLGTGITILTASTGDVVDVSIVENSVEALNAPLNFTSSGIEIAVQNGNSTVEALIERNVVRNYDTGLSFFMLSSIVDAGGGSLGSTGFNSVINSGYIDIGSDIFPTIKAENNYWGGSSGSIGGSFPPDNDPYLTIDPN